MSRVASLIEKAVNRTMLARTIGEVPDDAEAFSEATRMEFVRMLASDGTTEENKADSEVSPSSSVDSRALDQLNQMKEELAQRRRELAEEEQRPAAEDLALERKLRQTFAAWGGDPNRPSPMEREIIQLAVSELRQQRGETREVKLSDHQREIDMLERRITKLSGLLEKSESDLKRLVAAGQIDPGLASIYDSVQGLGDEDPMLDRKAELMTSIFESNVRMREELAEA